MINRSSRWMRRLLPAVSAVALSLAIASCSIDDLVRAELPPTELDPEMFETPEGAMAIYRGALREFRRGFGGSTGYVLISGRFTDELTTGAYFGVYSAELDPGLNTFAEIDTRAIEDDNRVRMTTLEPWYRHFNLARNQAAEAIKYLSEFGGSDLSTDLIGRLYAIRGYSMVFLSEALCSGIPLSEFKSPSGMEYKPGSTNEEVYKKAVAQFDSAFLYISDSLDYKYFATVGKARALANLGELDEAADLVADIPTSFQYKARYAEPRAGSPSGNYFNILNDFISPESNFGTVADREGINGLPYASSNDPRIPLVPAPTQDFLWTETQYMLPAWMAPARAPWNGLSTKAGKAGEDIVVASGIEARLFEAEAAAADDDPGFLDILNTLRTTCIDAATCPDPAPAGTGGVEGLPPLTDPGNTKDRIKLVFDERAYWTFLTGQRQGALRRMVRLHGFDGDEVYPTGEFVYGGIYGVYTNLPVPASERQINTLYEGCFNRDA